MATKVKIQFILLVCSLLLSRISFSQTNLANTPTQEITVTQLEVPNPLNDIKLDAVKVQQFEKYVEFRHSFGPGGFETWKKTNKLLYAQEMWYYSESFYVIRNYFPDGITMDEAMVDVTRCESKRKQNTEGYVKFPGFRDVIVLLPESQLIYKPK